MKPQIRVDLRKATLDELIDFVFDHPEPSTDSDGHREFWCWTVHLDVAIDPAHQLSLMAELFRGARVLLPRFSPAQIDQGLWFMFSGGSEWFTALLADRDLPWAARRAVIRAIYELYDGLLTHIEVDQSGYMLWDLLLGKFDDDYTEIADTCFETLVRILNLPQAECQRAALHGLGHLEHVQTARVVSEYLRDQAPSDPELREYAGEVLRGEDIL
jgi:hypothetical protein